MGEGILGLKSFFDVIVESYKVGLRKPDKRIYEMCVSQLGVDFSDCIFLDDLGINLRSAKQLGMTTIKVNVSEDIKALRELENILGFPILPPHQHQQHQHQQHQHQHQQHQHQQHQHQHQHPHVNPPQQPTQPQPPQPQPQQPQPSPAAVTASTPGGRPLPTTPTPNPATPPPTRQQTPIALPPQPQQPKSSPSPSDTPHEHIGVIKLPANRAGPPGGGFYGDRSKTVASPALFQTKRGDPREVQKDRERETLSKAMTSDLLSQLNERPNARNSERIAPPPPVSVPAPFSCACPCPFSCTYTCNYTRTLR
eukprot:TRINITY_DN4033_c0_g3_i2.p1 TRINITY_DN4033_c0_g3~~TRINITY_DN4033_c0_g3_i2.p1  ORF type:complete len:329 (-),score=111.77 TRINITY_DN4033_c0_g3_i2:4-933(-)